MRNEESAQELIPGLPNDVALDCLARVPHRFHPGLRLVSRGWRNLLTAPCFHQHRERIEATEDLIFLVQALLGKNSGGGGEKGDGATVSSPEAYGLSIYNATDGSWHRLATPKPIPLFAQVAAVDGKLVVMGGWDPVTLDPVTEVRVLDLKRGEWRIGASMVVARSFFACAAVAGKVYVAGGHDAWKNALQGAEAYDVEEDRWLDLPAMGEKRDECKGVAAGGRFWAVSGYGTEGQGRFLGAAEWYDADAGKWKREEGMWEWEEGVCVGLAGGRMWSVECGGGRENMVREYKGNGKGWREVAPLPARTRVRPSAAAIDGGERVFLVAEVEAEAEGMEPNRGWILEVASATWSRLEIPSRFNRFTFSTAAVRL
ncbi:F-box/kelch-repeat protein At2g44130-like [Zingiber officinale]|uniref:F-box/kelch-repeat protein At2g44130-like n=1 Tax=Zingiber officinale TaxID=94328 RepID=UPI001C4D9ACB|nr:F-box/kelch-repeat protein At2g44130-like [Zingiber officinale]